MTTQRTKNNINDTVRKNPSETETGLAVANGSPLANSISPQKFR